MTIKPHFRRKSRLSPGYADGQWFWVPDCSLFDEPSDMVLLPVGVLERGPIRGTFLACLETLIDRDTSLSTRTRTVTKNAVNWYLLVVEFATITFNPAPGGSYDLDTRRSSHPFHRYVAAPAHWVYTTEGVGKRIGKIAINVLQRRTTRSRSSF